MVHGFSLWKWIPEMTRFQLVFLLFTMLLFHACHRAAQSGSASSNHAVMTPSTSDSDAVAQSDAPLICSLKGKAFAERKQALQTEVFALADSIQELDAGYRVRFPYDPGFIMKLNEYLIAENECCPFFVFELRLHGQQAIQLSISGPEGTKGMIREVLLGE